MNKPTVVMVDEFTKACPFDTVAEELTCKLVGMGYFDAPASTHYHGSYRGGLLDHSIAVYHDLQRLTIKMHLEWSRPQSVWVIAMLHDLCKADQYIWEDGVYRFDTEKTGHAEKSLKMIQDLPIELTEEEIACIRYHMGAFTDKAEWSGYTNAIHDFPNVLWTHTADMMASHLENT